MGLISFVLRSCARMTTIGSLRSLRGFVCGGALLGKHVKHVKRFHIRKNQLAPCNFARTRRRDP